MSMSRWKSLLIVAAVVAVVLLGHTAGRIGELGALGCLSGVALAVGSFFRRPPIAPESNRWGAAFLLIYALIAIETDAIMWAWSERGVLIAIGWLIPLIAGSLVYPSWGLWLVGAAYWLMLFSGVSALTYTVTHIHSGMGFLISWRS